MISQIKNSKLFIKWTHWEYWPIWLAYLPVIPIIIFYALKMRRFFFFSNVNPQFKTGALMGASKYDILKQIPQEYLPTTLFFNKMDNEIDKVVAKIQGSGMRFPVIAKPDVGERGLLVALVHNEQELKEYIAANKIDFIIQEYISLPNECGIFYIRKPSEKEGRVVSVGLKNFFIIVGDGHKSVRELIRENPRYILQIERLEQKEKNLLDRVLAKDEELNLEPIGNHGRGTGFLDGNHLISPKLDKLFDQINKEMDEVYYGRFDLKYDTWEKLLQGENIRILEMNGIASEPIHIYDQNVKIRDKYKSFYDLWKTIYEISYIQRARGIEPIHVTTAFKAFIDYKKYIRSINSDW